jgi:glycosyltransferase involved in cell wall biosynthesis
VPAHNYGAYLPETLESLRTQTRLPAEVVVVDDGSTDETPEVIRAWHERMSDVTRFHTIRHETSLGVVASMNAGIAATSSPWFVVVDADDRCAPRFIEALSDRLASCDAAYAYPRLRLFGTENGDYVSHDFDAGRLIFEGNYIPMVALVRREAFTQTRGYRQLPTHVDWDLWLSLLEHGHSGSFVDEPLYLWRRHDGAMTHRSAARRLQVRTNVWWAHRRLLARHFRSGPRWLLSAVRRRVRHAPGQVLTESGWVTSP